MSIATARRVLAAHGYKHPAFKFSTEDGKPMLLYVGRHPQYTPIRFCGGDSWQAIAMRLCPEQ